MASPDNPGYTNYRMVTFVRAHSQARGPAKVVLLILACYTGQETRTCWPTIDTLVEETGFERDAVISGIKELERLGEIEVLRRGRKGNLYTITLQAPVDNSQLVRLSEADFNAEVARMVAG